MTTLEIEAQNIVNDVEEEEVHVTD